MSGNQLPTGFESTEVVEEFMAPKVSCLSYGIECDLPELGKPAHHESRDGT